MVSFLTLGGIDYALVAPECLVLVVYHLPITLLFILVAPLCLPITFFYLLVTLFFLPVTLHISLVD